jgi:hypothetical protein
MSHQPSWPQGQVHPATPTPYPAQPPAGYGYGQPPAPPASMRTSVAGPRAMTVIGAVLLVAAIVLLALAVPAMVSTIPLHVVDTAGNPGSATLATLDAPGTTTVRLEPGYYDVDVACQGAFGSLEGAISVVGADGTRVHVADPTVTTTYTVLGTSVISAATFHVSRPGEYVVTAPQVAPATARVLLTRGKDPATVARAGLELAGAFVLGAVGLGLTIGGGVWWGSRARNRKRLAGWQSAAPGAYSSGAALPPR